MLVSISVILSLMADVDTESASTPEWVVNALIKYGIMYSPPVSIGK